MEENIDNIKIRKKENKRQGGERKRKDGGHGYPKGKEENGPDRLRWDLSNDGLCPMSVLVSIKVLTAGPGGRRELCPVSDPVRVSIVDIEFM